MVITGKHTPPHVNYWQDQSGVIVVKLYDYCRVYHYVLHDGGAPIQPTLEQWKVQVLDRM